MTESEVGTERDAPHPWVIVIDSMTVAEARALGKWIARGKFSTGRFLSGTVGENLARYVQWKREREEAEGR